MQISFRCHKVLNFIIIGLLLFGLAPIVPAQAQQIVPAAGPAAQPELLKDIYTANASSDPSGFFAFGSQIYYSATDPEHGRELWVSDGTELGTHMAIDLITGSASSYPSNLALFQGNLVFTTENDGVHLSTLWMTSGTPEGLVQLFTSGYEYGYSSVTWVFPLGDWLYFQCGERLLRFGGQSNQLEVLTPASFRVRMNSVILLDGKFYFTGSDGTTGYELWSLDLATLQMSLVRDICSSGCTDYMGQESSSPNQLTVVGTTIYFSATDADHGAELWASDGTLAGTRLVMDIMPGTQASNIARLTVADGWLYFFANDGVHGLELWRSDGTTANTTLVADIDPGSLPSYPGEGGYVFAGSGQTVFFTARDAAKGQGHGVELWAVPITAAGVAASPVLLEIEPGPESSTPRELVQLGGMVCFSAYESTGGAELWCSDGTPSGTQRLVDVVPGPDGSSPTGLAVIDGSLYYSAVDAQHGRELWVSSGAPENGQLIADAVTVLDSAGSSPSSGIVTNVGGAGIRYFSARDPLHGRELWRTDGTTDGTWMVKDIDPRSANDWYDLEPKSMAELNGILYFSAWDEDDARLWRTDGTLAGTWLLNNPDSAKQYESIVEVAAAGGQVFFTAYNSNYDLQLWKSDGTPAGTVLVKTLPGEVLSDARQLTVLGNMVIFKGLRKTGMFSSDFDIWRSDGTEDGTLPILGPITYGYDALDDRIVVGNKLYFDLTAADGLWVTDGTAAGTMQIGASTASSATFIDPTQFTHVGNVLYFTALTTLSGTAYEQPGLWKLTPGASTASFVAFLSFDSTIVKMGLLGGNTLMYLSRDDYNLRRYDWFTFDTSTQTKKKVCSDCYPNNVGDAAFWFANVYFAAFGYSPNDTPEGLWVTDGSSAGTMPVLNPVTNQNFVVVEEFLSTTKALYFAADDGTHGIEPWVIPSGLDNQVYLPMLGK